MQEMLTDKAFDQVKAVVFDSQRQRHGECLYTTIVVDVMDLWKKGAG